MTYSREILLISCLGNYHSLCLNQNVDNYSFGDFIASASQLITSSSATSHVPAEPCMEEHPLGKYNYAIIVL